MSSMAPQLKQIVRAYHAASPSEADEVEHLRNLVDLSRIALEEAHQALAAAWTREREAELELKRAKAARVQFHGRVRLEVMQRERLCEKLDEAEWLADGEWLAEQAERAAA